MFGFAKKTEERSAANVPQSAPNFFERMGWAHLGQSGSGAVVTIETALGVPAVWAAVNFLSGTLAGLPVKVYRDGRKERVEVKTGVARLLKGSPNDQMSSFEWRKYLFDGVFTNGRSFTYIERNNIGAIVNLWPIDPACVTVKMDGFAKRYHVSMAGRRQVTYDASEVLDIPFMLKADMVSHRSPLVTCRDAIGMAISSTAYGGKVFQSGGLPPAVIQGPFSSGTAAQRASDDVAKAMQKLGNEGKPLLALPQGHEIKTVGFSPEQMQMLELQRFLVEQIARIYSIPPVFLQDLTHGTFSNTEQQDLHFVKHTVKRWVEQVEQEMNLKLFGRNSNTFVEFNVNGLLRGDIKTRMEAHSTAIQNAIYTPAHAAKMENAPYHADADQVFIQGGTMPIGDQGDDKES
jgi:HK97 family phage portal protein